MAQDAILLRAFIRGAVESAKSAGTTPRRVLTDIICGRFKSEATNGRTVISTESVGNKVTFAYPKSLSPSDLMQTAEEAIEFLEALDDPDNPDLSTFKRKNRLRFTFDQSQVT